MKKTPYISTIILVLFFWSSSIAQVSEGGTPHSFLKKLSQDEIPQIQLPSPDMENIRKEDRSRSNMLKPARMAVNIEANLSFSDKARWEKSGNTWVGRLSVAAENAKALILYYDEFRIPEGGKLFLYNSNNEQLIGAFTQQNNPPKGYFANELIHGEKLTLEYNFQGESLEKPELLIGDVGYAYRFTGKDSKGFGDSGDCEVNVNCSDGDAWRDEQRGVARILIRRGGSAYWCSGSLLNNTNQDYRPYLLSADHCGGDATEDDLQQWVFYFNYESATCNNPILEPSSESMVGASKIARGGTMGDSGSDFYLVELNSFIPSDYEVYFNGWSRIDEPANSGVSIHHPAGDIKKITTFDETLTSSTYANAKNAHWRVYWTTTDNGAAATEGGSSGSPIFNEQGLVVGALTGGLSSCSNQTAPDYYGKFSYSWDQMGDAADQRLQPWLDPAGTGVMNMPGLGGQPQDLLIADFTVQGDTALPIGEAADFSSRSIGQIVDWSWTFEGGSPNTSDQTNPTDIVYNSYGSYDVKLTITGAEGDTNTLVREDYIRIRAKAFPNPVTDYLTLDFGHDPIGNMELMVYNMYGETVEKIIRYFSVETSYMLDMTGYSDGLYLVRTNINGDISEYKIVKSKTED